MRLFSIALNKYPFSEFIPDLLSLSVCIQPLNVFFFCLCAPIRPPPRDLDCLGVKNRATMALPIEEVLQTLNDLITYFQLPDAELEHEEKQIKLRSLKNRQNLFKQEVSFSVKPYNW